ncbi:unnamed protein product [Brassica oleracea]|uniref:ABC transporter domain-containing protein n=1 Tax=Brassica oleracea TaxID=3712 RepID=A0A3P6H626_BRAOL|nr:unnamed protein product [Brassica oleracea]
MKKDAKIQNLSKSGGGGLLREPENDSDILIKCRDAYKSFGDKHILKGVVTIKIVYIVESLYINCYLFSAEEFHMRLIFIFCLTNYFCTHIRHGEAVGVIGPFGTGKSTILKIMAGLLASDKGEVYIRGKKRAGLISDEEISGFVCVSNGFLVFQSAALFYSLTVRENVGFLHYESSKMSENQISELVTQTLQYTRKAL